jgi:hypothetical protein
MPPGPLRARPYGASLAAVLGLVGIRGVADIAVDDDKTVPVAEKARNTVVILANAAVTVLYTWVGRQAEMSGRRGR